MIDIIVKILLIVCMILTPIGIYLIIDSLMFYEKKKKIKKINIIGFIIFILLVISEIMTIINYPFSTEYLGELKEITGYGFIIILLLTVIYLIALVIIEKVKKISIQKKNPKTINVLLALGLSFFALFISYGMIRNLIEMREHDASEHINKTIQILENNEGDSE